MGFSLLKNFLLKDAEGEYSAEGICFHEMETTVWEALREEYSIPFNEGIICIIDFDEDAGKLTKTFAEKFNHKFFFRKIKSRF